MNSTPNRLLTLILGAICIASGFTAAQGSIVAPAYYNGTRTTVGTTGSGGGLAWNTPAGAWSNGLFSISWSITPVGSEFQYQYTLKTPGALGGRGAQLSHWLLELSPFNSAGASLDSYWVDVFSTPGAPGPGSYTDVGIGPVGASVVGDGADSGASNSGIPGSLYGVKFTRDSDVDTTVVSFISTQAPVWGDFYARDGGGNGPGTIYAYNLGFGTDPSVSETNFSNWIARPDGVTTPPPGDVPEAASCLIWLGLGVASAFAMRKRVSPC